MQAVFYTVDGSCAVGVLELVNLELRLAVGGRCRYAGREVDVELPDRSSLARLRAGDLLANQSGGWQAASRCDGSMMTTWNRNLKTTYEIDLLLLLCLAFS